MAVEGVREETGKALYLLYWYKSTNTDTAAKSREETVDGEKCIQVAFDSLYLLYWYKSTNTDAAVKSREGDSRRRKVHTSRL